MTALDVLTYIGSGGLGAGLWAIANWKAKKKTEGANADMAVAEADAKVSDNWATYAAKLEQRMESLETDNVNKTREIAKLVSEVQQIRYALRDANVYRCTVHPCDKRTPPFGTFHSLEDE